MNDRYSFMARITYENGEEYEEYFGTEAEAREFAENLDTVGVAGWEIYLIDWIWRSDTRIDGEWFD